MKSSPVMHVVSTPDHLLHDNTIEVEWGVPNGHWEAPVRAEVIGAALRADPSMFEFVSPTDHGRAPIDAVHDPGLVNFLARAWTDFQSVRRQREVFPDTYLHPAIRENMGPAPVPTEIQGQLGYWCFESMTPLLEGTYTAARAAVDVALTATDLVLGGERVAYGLCRPPGHHAPRAAFGGYCYFNNAAVAAHHIASTTGTKVTVLDVDYHHGNGTQQIFYERDDVQYVSLHGDPNRAYPYLIGFVDEVGGGRGRGTTTNLPLPKRTANDAYATALDEALAAIDAFNPSTIVVSLGVDTHENDPIGDFKITTDAYEDHGRAVAALRRPMVVLQEGGYYVPALGENVRRWLFGTMN
jgi:acetoin utilization deacetylase AcuC-like enzyme